MTPDASQTPDTSQRSALPALTASAVASVDSGRAAPPIEPAWKRNLATLSAAQFLHAFAYSAAVPFIAAFFAEEFGLVDPGQLAIWSGLAISAHGVGMAIGSPLWGAVADRFGKKAMIIRALLMSATWIGLISVSRGPADVAALLLLQGLSGAVQTLAVSLIASETPRESMGHSVGVIWSATAVGAVLGPISGGLAVTVVGYRGSFLLASILILVASAIVLFRIREARKSTEERERERAQPSGMPRGALVPLALLLAANALAFSLGTAAPTLIALKLVSLVPGDAGPMIGAAVAALGLSSAMSSIGHGRVRTRMGYRRTILAASAVGILALLLLADAAGPREVIVGAAVIGVAGGTLRPIVTSMIALQAKPSVRAFVIGLSGTAGAGGSAIGPLFGSWVAAIAGISAAFLAMLIAPLALVGLFLFAIKEPDEKGVETQAHPAEVPRGAS